LDLEQSLFIMSRQKNDHLRGKVKDKSIADRKIYNSSEMLTEKVKIHLTTGIQRSKQKQYKIQ